MALYQFFCEICNWKRITDGSEPVDLVELKSTQIAEGIPTLDSNGKIIDSKLKPPKRRYRCPQCGRVVFPKKIADPQQKILQQIEQEQRAVQAEKEIAEYAELMRQREMEIIEEQKLLEKKKRARRKIEAEVRLDEFNK